LHSSKYSMSSYQVQQDQPKFLLVLMYYCVWCFILTYRYDCFVFWVPPVSMASVFREIVTKSLYQ